VAATIGLILGIEKLLQTFSSQFNFGGWSSLGFLCERMKYRMPVADAV
jgi:hypothetical protein